MIGAFTDGQLIWRLCLFDLQAPFGSPSDVSSRLLLACDMADASEEQA